MAPEIADQREIALVPVQVRRDGVVARPPQHRPGFVRQGEVVVDAGDDLHSAPVAVREALPVDGLHAPDVRAAVSGNRDAVFGRQLAGHARAPEQLVAKLTVDHLVQLGELVKACVGARVHARDELELRFAEVRRDSRVRQGGAQARGMRRLCQGSVRPDAQAFLLDAAQHALEHGRRESHHALANPGQVHPPCFVAFPAGRTRGVDQSFHTRLAFVRSLAKEPSIVPWEKQFDVEQARDSAMAVFWAKGYKATSMQELLEAMGIQRGSFYDTFGSKRGILLDSLRRYDRERAKAFAELRRSATAAQVIGRVFRRIVEGRGGKSGPTGCFLVSSASELAPGDPEIASIVNHAFEETESFLRAVIEDGKSRAEIPGNVEPRPAARALLGMLLGMQVLARSGADRRVLASISDQAMAFIVQASPRAPHRPGERKKSRVKATK